MPSGTGGGEIDLRGDLDDLALLSSADLLDSRAIIQTVRHDKDRRTETEWIYSRLARDTCDYNSGMQNKIKTYICSLHTKTVVLWRNCSTFGELASSHSSRFRLKQRSRCPTQNPLLNSDLYFLHLVLVCIKKYIYNMFSFEFLRCWLADCFTIGQSQTNCISK